MLDALKRLRAGGSFEAFVRETSTEWTRLSRHLFRRYRLPEGVEAEDVAQEMLEQAWRAVREWDPERSGMALDRFVTWRAYYAAARWCNVQRNAYRRSWKEPSRFPVRFDPPRPGDPRTYEERVPDATDLETVVERRIEVARQIEALDDEAERVAMLALLAVGGDEESAARVLVEDRRVRIAFRLYEDSAARELVARAVRASRRIMRAVA